MRDLTPLFCQLALAQASSLPSSERADLYDYAAQELARHGYPAQSEAAHSAARDIRNANAAQSHFDALLSAALDVNKVQ